MNQIEDWDKLRTFHVVAQVGNLTHAGAELNVSQSAISRQISFLESSLGMTLFNRHARGLILTPEGEVLLKATRKIFSYISTAVSQLHEVNNLTEGTLKIATTIALGSVWLAPRLKDFCQEFPQLKLSLMLTDKSIDFSTREADMSVRFSQESLQKDPFIVEEKLYLASLKIYASQSYIKENGFPRQPKDLKDHRLIVFGTESFSPVEGVNWLLGLGAKTGSRHEPFLEINNAYGILQAVKSGLGIASLADFIAHDHKDLVPLLLRVRCPKIYVSFIYPKQLAGTKRIGIFRQFLQKEFQKIK